MKLFHIVVLASLSVAVSCDVSQRQEQQQDPQSKYISVDLRSYGLENDPHNYSLKADLGRTPVMVTGNFMSVPEKGGVEKSCFFQVVLNESESKRIEKLAQKLKFCSRDAKYGPNQPKIEEVGTTDQGTGAGAGEDSSWICKGREEFYKYLKRAVGPKIPGECPKGALSKFR